MEILETIAGIIIALLLFGAVWVAVAVLWRFFNRLTCRYARDDHHRTP